MAWEVEFADEFERWWHQLAAEQQGKIDAIVRVLEEHGPNLGFSCSSGVNGSRFPEMRELRVQCHGKPIRIFTRHLKELKEQENG